MDTLFNNVELPISRAAIALARKQPEKAIDALHTLTPTFERMATQGVYFRGLAYLQLNKGTEAATEFQKILDQKGNTWGQYYPVSYVGLARGARMAGDIARAQKAYKAFLDFWMDADADIPILIAARKEYAALK